ncbi:MOSC domain-containing protein [Xylogone sp. PMI_703]|nr:MOSC domain-containing protein [Xylogone sp. PMI_703]
MPTATLPDLYAPFERDVLLDVRTGKMKPMKGLSITSGIIKSTRSEPVFVSITGIDNDEHDLTFHGGVDKAVHQYSPHHYASWREEFPENAKFFEVGGFGENLVSNGMNERNICIGDIIRVGNDVVLQVSLPRQPCFKLNHRFEIKGFAPNTFKKSRTGWYYRVLKEGYIKVGDEIVLVERKHPKWTIERVQEYLHRDPNNLPMLEELQAIEEFGEECKGAFKKRVARLRAEEDENQNGANKVKETWSDYEIIEKRKETARITSFVLQAVGKEEDGNSINPGCHVRLKLPNGLIRPYSLVGGHENKLQIGVALEDNSRGGSLYLHQNTKVGDRISVGKITESVPVAGMASNHLFIAGGIGITAFLPTIQALDSINYNYELHYAVRSADDVPFRNLLEKVGPKLSLYDKTKGQRMDIPGLIKKRKWNTHIYVCGPQRMVDEVLRAGKECGMPLDELHFEAFQIETSGDPFIVELKKSNKTLHVDGDKTLLEVMRAARLEVDSSCETGNCGTCRVEVCSGRVEHRGSALTEDDKRTAMLSCVSRGVGHLVIDF